jgi:hypothetical protein
MLESRWRRFRNVGHAHPPQTHGNVQSLPVFQAGAEASPQFVPNLLRFLSTSRHKERLLL